MEEKLTLRELQLTLTDILEYVHNFCKKNNIEYCVIYGTLLGAIRHKGFIPWDDDVDIAMTRENYKKFTKLMIKENSKYKLHNLYTDSKCLVTWSKVIDTDTYNIDTYTSENSKIGAFLDVFCIDRYNDDGIIKKLTILNRLRYYSCSRYKNIKIDKGIKAKIKFLILYSISKLFSASFFAKKVIKLTNSNVDKNGRFEGILAFCEAYKPGLFSETTEAQFENLTVNIPVHYDELLTLTYGDYMTLPPIEEQEGSHFLSIHKKK